MRPWLRITLLLTAVAAALLVVAVIGSRENRAPGADPRRSSYLATPAGSRGLWQALPQLGVAVERSRRRLPETVRQPMDTAALFAVLDPTWPLDWSDGVALRGRLERGGHVLLAGPGASEVMRCFGYRVRWRDGDSLPVRRPAAPLSSRPPRVSGILIGAGTRVVTDSSRFGDIGLGACRVTEPERVDTLLLTAGGRPAALRLALADGATVTLLADGALFSNTVLRTTDLGPALIAAFFADYPSVIFDEYHQGYGPTGSTGAALWQWAVGSPAGWVVLQLVLVAVLILLSGWHPVGGVFRFGPPLPPPDRRRRSPLEHVRALATALGAARGHDVAIELMVRGLRRRLSERGRPPRRDAAPAEWITSLQPHLRTASARAAAVTLLSLTRQSQPAESVPRAAHAVEDLWQDLKP